MSVSRSTISSHVLTLEFLHRMDINRGNRNRPTYPYYGKLTGSIMWRPRYLYPHTMAGPKSRLSGKYSAAG